MIASIKYELLESLTKYCHYYMNFL